MTVPSLTPRSDVLAKEKLSPKVTWPFYVGALLTALATFLAAITPDMLSFAGQFAVPLVLALGVLAQAITGYLKEDPLRHDQPGV